MVNKFRQIQQVCEAVAKPEEIDPETQSPDYQSGYAQGFAQGQFVLAQTVLASAYHGRQASMKQGDPNA